MTQPIVIDLSSNFTQINATVQLNTFLVSGQSGPAGNLVFFDLPKNPAGYALVAPGGEKSVPMVIQFFGNNTGVTFTFTGLDDKGNFVSTAIAGGSGVTLTTGTVRFSTVISINASAPYTTVTVWAARNILPTVVTSAPAIAVKLTDGVIVFPQAQRNILLFSATIAGVNNFALYGEDIFGQSVYEEFSGNLQLNTVLPSSLVHKIDQIVITSSVASAGTISFLPRAGFGNVVQSGWVQLNRNSPNFQVTQQISNTSVGTASYVISGTSDAIQTFSNGRILPVSSPASYTIASGAIAGGMVPTQIPGPVNAIRMTTSITSGSGAVWTITQQGIV